MRLLQSQTVLLHAQEADCRARAGAGCADSRCHYHVHKRGCGGAYIKVLSPAQEADSFQSAREIKSRLCSGGGPALTLVCALLGSSRARTEHAPAGLQVAEPQAFTERQNKKRKRQWGDPKFATETGSPSPAAGSKGGRRSAGLPLCFHRTGAVSATAEMLLCPLRTAPDSPGVKEMGRRVNLRCVWKNSFFICALHEAAD